MNLIIISYHLIVRGEVLGELRGRGFELRANNKKKLNLIIKIKIYAKHGQRLVFEVKYCPKLT